MARRGRLVCAVALAIACAALAPRSRAAAAAVDAAVDAANALHPSAPPTARPAPGAGGDEASRGRARAASAAGWAWAAPAGAPKPKARVLAEIRAENEWKNSLVLWPLPAAARAALPPLAAAWLRNWVLATALYLFTGFAWAYYVYYAFGDRLYAPGATPARRDMAEQARVALLAMPIYAMLPALTEAAVERGWTLAYARVADVGLARYALFFAAYMALVEFFVYWQHRLLHDIRIGYRLLHHVHHKYNKEHTLSPFAGLAFHPLDGILQALPYAWTLCLVPMHFLTHELLLFATAVWTTNIHDCLHGAIAPIMGAGFHTIHHTTYRHNYGHYTTYFDALFGSLISPEDFEKSHVAEGSETR
jgi:lathosterol oxidase